MNSYRVIIHYVIPSKLGGIQSATQRLTVRATTEDEAEKIGLIMGVSNPNYLYTQMVETSLLNNPLLSK